MAYNEPIATVIACERESDFDRITLSVEVNDAPILLDKPPRAPASLVKRETGKDVWSYDLHRAISKEGDFYIYASYKLLNELPSVGDRYIFRCWWRQDQLDAAQSDSSCWQWKAFVPKFTMDHEHCITCWKGISAQEKDNNFGYTNGHNWMCKECHENYVLSGFGKKLGDDIG